MVRAITLLDFLIAFEPDASELTGEDLERYWLQRACPELAAAADSLGVSSFEIRRHTWTMLQESVRRLTGSKEVCGGIREELPEGIRAIIVVGSSARGEAVPDSDIDLNVYITADLERELWSKRNREAQTPRELLMHYEQRLRRLMQATLLDRLQAQRLCSNASKLSLKPFTREDLELRAKRERGIHAETLLAPIHLSNILFGATPMLGWGTFNRLLDAKLVDAASFFLGLLGRVGLLTGARERLSELQGSDLVKALHEIAASMSAILAAGMQAHDPQVPYWWTLDLDRLGVFDGVIRLALLHALAVVTICRGGAYQADPAQAAAIVDRTLDVLPLAVDAVIERLMEEGTDEATIGIWQQIRSRLLDRGGAVELAQQLGMLNARR